jgi:hypothetical protein
MRYSWNSRNFPRANRLECDCSAHLQAQSLTNPYAFLMNPP